jgi:hypothetical protein
MKHDSYAILSIIDENGNIAEHVDLDIVQFIGLENLSMGGPDLNEGDTIFNTYIIDQRFTNPDIIKQNLGLDPNSNIILRMEKKRAN